MNVFLPIMYTKLHEMINPLGYFGKNKAETDTPIYPPSVLHTYTINSPNMISLLVN